MKNNTKKQKKKKNRKPIHILAIFFAVFGFFIYLISRPSPEDNAKKELALAYTKENVKEVWEKYKMELHDNEDFLFAVRTKLSTLSLTDEDIKGCIKWLPPAPVSLNIIVVPDLSNRIDRIPGQIDSDKKVLEGIWNSFEAYSKLKKDSHDRLMIDVTDKHQAGGKFEKIANNLRFDLSEHKGKSNRLYFSDKLRVSYINGIDSMYAAAQNKSLGADYHLYFRQYLEDNLKEDDLFNSYKNKIIILTDGYLEPQTCEEYTKLNHGETKFLYPAVKNGNVLHVIDIHKLNIPSANIDLSNSEILICEVNERKAGEGKDYEILKAYWYDWLSKMNAKDKKFMLRNKASDATKETIKKFISS